MTIQVQLIVGIVRLASRGLKRQRNTNKAVKTKLEKLDCGLLNYFQAK
jgi:hypothetical protein